MVPNVEICIDSFESAEAIAPKICQGGNRVELCANLIHGGGITPSIGLFQHVAEIIPPRKIMVMIRPRTGSFIYTKTETDTMLRDIKAFKKAGAGGFVFGCLHADGHVDLGKLEILSEAARHCEVTFHRAFDVTPDWKKAFDDIAGIKGITRILTSGHAKRAIEGVHELSELISLAQSAKHQIAIVPASGIDTKTATQLLEQIPGLKELHLSSSGVIIPTPTPSSRRGEELGFGLEEWKLNPEKINEFWVAIEKIRP